VKTVFQLRKRALHFKMRDNNELMTEMWNEDTTGFPFSGNAKFDPRNSPILTLGPLYGRRVWVIFGKWLSISANDLARLKTEGVI